MKIEKRQNLIQKYESSLLDYEKGSYQLSAVNPAVDLIMKCTSPTTRRTYTTRLNEVAKIFGIQQDRSKKPLYRLVPWQLLRMEHIAYVVHYMNTEIKDKNDQITKKRKSYSTINLTLSVLKQVAIEMFMMGSLPDHEYKRIMMVKSVKGSRVPSGRVLSESEISTYSSVCKLDKTPAGCRDALILGLLYVCGMRRSEIASLRLSNYKPNDQCIQFIGKRNKERKAWLDPGTIKAMEEWITYRNTGAGPLLYAINKSGVVNKGRGVSDQALYYIVEKRIKQSNLSHTTPHDFRRTFVTTMLKKGADISLVADLVGHSSIETTKRYDQRKEEEAKKAQSKMYLPY